MNKIYKLILAGFVAFGASCSNESSTAGATTESNSAQANNLTEEQMALLEKSFYTLVDSAKVNINIDSHSFDSLIHEIIEQPGLTPSPEALAILKLWTPFTTKADTSFYHRSRDNRWTCDVTAFSQESGAMLRQMYDASPFNDAGPRHISSGNFSTRIVEIDSVPVIMRTVGLSSYWGYGVTCAEFLKQFKDSCNASNGIFKDYGEGCNDSSLNLACSTLIPEGMNIEKATETFTEEFLNECKEDSIRYAPANDEQFTLDGCEDHSGSDENGDYYFYTTCRPEESDPSLDSLSKDWQLGLTQTIDSYHEQFAVFKELDGTHSYLYEHPYLEFADNYTYKSLVAYNTFPSANVASTYREEGIYHLPDSLLKVFFPKVAESPTALKVLEKKNETYYIIVIKDIGAKGHFLRSIGDDNIIITDIVKSGESCPEDTTVHYSVYLVRGAANWDIVEKTITRQTFESPLWNCDDPENLEQIEPYGEWVYPYGVI